MENNLEKQHMEFKLRGLFLVKLHDKYKKLFSEKKISRKKYREMKEWIREEWNKAYNRHPYISPSVKKGYNLLWEGLI